MGAKVDSLKLFEEEAQPVIKLNQEHRFEITPCEFKYNDKIFRLGGDIQELVKVFGEYNRNIRKGDAYVWDDYGFSVLCNLHTNETSEFRICFDWCEQDSTGTLPFSCFKGAILVDGIKFGNGISYENFSRKLKGKESCIDFEGFYIWNKTIYNYNCNYDDVEYGDESNHAFIINRKSDILYRAFLLSDSRPEYRTRIEYEKRKE